MQNNRLPVAAQRNETALENAFPILSEDAGRTGAYKRAKKVEGKMRNKTKQTKKCGQEMFSLLSLDGAPFMEELCISL